MFRSATLRLTLSYLGILMLVSIFFSIVLYGGSARELERNYPSTPYGQVDQDLFSTFYSPDIYRQERLDRLRQIESAIIYNLIGFNVLVLIGGGGASFLLAKYTLRPIEEAMQAQSRFTSDASHELRTPLTAMKTEIEVALRGGKLTQSEADHLLKSNLEEIERLEAITSSLLVLAKSQNGGIEPVFKPVLLAEILTAATKRVRPLAKKHQISIKLPDANLSIEADKKLLTELVTILLDNAIKYGRDKTEVEIATKTQAQQLTITIADHGVGISPVDLPHVFDRFYRADSSRARRDVGGHGLGLAIARSIVLAHHGTIDVTSKLDYGTKFRIVLPIQQNS